MNSRRCMDNSSAFVYRGFEKAPRSDLKIRLVRLRDCGISSGVIFMNVFRADLFAPLGQRWTPVGYGRRPRCREDAFVLNRKLKLQPLPLVAGVGHPPFSNSCVKPPIFFSVAFLRSFGGFIIDEPI